MPSNVELAVHRSGTAVIIGRSNVGKSTLLNSALRQKLAIVSPTPQTTRDRILGVVRHRDAQIALLDTPGLHRPRSKLGRRMNAAARESIVGADVMVFMTALSARMTGPLEPHPGDKTLLTDLGKDTPSILVINKVDLCKDKTLLLPLLEAFSKLRPFEAVVPISARREDGVVRVLDEVAKLLPERGAVYAEDFLTDRPLRFFASEYIREQVFLATQQEVPHSVAVSIDRFDDTGPVVHIEATVHCARSGQRAILIGVRGEKMKAIGIAARKRIEPLVERQVNLKLWVKVTEGWTESPELMAEIGYDPEGGEVQNS
jgi:GTPase